MKRLKNLWRISEIDVSTVYGKLTIESLVKAQNEITNKPKMAQIIRREDLAKKFIQND